MDGDENRRRAGGQRSVLVSFHESNDLLLAVLFPVYVFVGLFGCFLDYISP